MENFQWLAPLKSSVLLVFFLTFAGIILVTLTGRSDERWANLALGGEEKNEQEGGPSNERG